MCAATEEHVGIIGGSRTHNELLAAFLAEATGLSCRCEASLAAFRTTGRLPDRGSPVLLLLDCLNLSHDAVLKAVAEVLRQAAANESLALFNLAPALTIEQDALRLGVKGFFYEGDSPGSITHGIQSILQGDYWVSRKILVDCLLHDTPEGHAVVCREPSLSRRENQVLALLVEGLSNKAIADRLCISLPTVKTHVSKIFRKIHLSSRLEAMSRAGRHPGP